MSPTSSHPHAMMSVSPRSSSTSLSTSTCPSPSSSTPLSSCTLTCTPTSTTWTPWKITCATPPRGALTATTSPSPSHLRAPEAHPRMNCDSEANIPVSQMMMEMMDVASCHTTGTRGELHRQNVVVPIRQIQDDMVKVIHKNAFRSASTSQPCWSFARVRALVAVSRTA